MTSWESTYHGITIRYKEQSVHIVSDEALLAFLSGPGDDALRLADHLHARYIEHFQRPLEIHRISLAIEILAHVFVDAMAQSIESFADRLDGDVLAPIARLMEKVKAHTEVIDCGEAAIDRDRPLWDALVPLHGIIFRISGRGA